ncbi:MAG: chorismate mutase, partial [Pseudomonadota bacterium]
RLGIDQIDKQLVRLIAQRQSYIEAAGRIKPRREDVHNQARIDDVVRKVVAEAGRCGLQERIAEPVWRELIDRSIDYEYVIWDSAHAQSQ